MSAPTDAAHSKPGIYLSGFVACIGALLLFYYSPVLFGGADYFLTDISYFFQPFCHFMAQCLKSGHTPFWNPYMYCGMSQVAIPSPGIFYPPTWLMIWFPFSIGLAIYLLLHQLLAGAGAWLLVSRLGKGTAAAAVAGLVCTFTGYMFALSSNFTLMATAAWLPLSVALMIGIGGKYEVANVSRVALTGVCCAMVVAPGRPEVAVPCLLVLALCAVWPLIDSAKEKSFDRTVVRTVVLRLVPLACAVGLSAPVTIPALEWARVSPRSQGLELRWVFTWSANWYDFVSLVLNHPVGDLMLLPNEYRNMVVSRLYYLPFLPSDYVGPAALTLACFGMCDARWKHRWLLLLIFVGFCLMAAGEYTPFAPAFLRLSSTLATLRYPVKMIIFPIFLIGLAGAVGMQLIADRKLPRAALLTATVIWFIALISGCVMIASPGLSDIMVPSENHRLMRQAQVLFGWSLIHASSLGLIFCGVTALFDFGKINFKMVTTFILVLVGLPMFTASLQFDRHWAPPAEVQTGGVVKLVRFLEFRSTLAERLQEHLRGGKRFLTLYFDPLVVPPWYAPVRNWKNDELFYLYARQLLLQDSNVAEAMPHMNGYEGAETVIYKELFREAFSKCSQNRKNSGAINDAPMARLCQFAATEIVVTQAFDRPPSGGKSAPDCKCLDPNYFEMLSEDRVDNTRTYRVKGSHPRVSFADSMLEFATIEQCRNALLNSSGAPPESAAVPPARKRSDTARAIAMFVSSDSTGLDSVLKERLLKSTQNTSWRDSHTSRGERAARLECDDVDRLEISTTSDVAELLLVADQYYPGWKARIDGKEVPIMRANVFSRAIEVPPGNHVVGLTYEPDSLKIGLWCAVATLGLLVSLMVPFLWLPRGKPSTAK